MQPALTDLVLSGTPQAVASIISVTILVYFLLASGDVFLRKLVTVIPTFHDKKRAVEITRQIETDISFYLLNFTMVNVGLGVAMAVVTALLGIPNPLLWGALVAVLNFVPYVGAITSMAILAMVGVQTFDSLPQALAAPAILACSRRHFRRGDHALRSRARAAAQSGRHLHLHPVVGLAVGHRRRAAGGAAVGELQDHLRACRAAAPDRRILDDIVGTGCAANRASVPHATSTFPSSIQENEHGNATSNPER